MVPTAAPTVMAAASPAGEDLDAIQAQLQLDRARLTSEVSSRLGSTSPSKPKASGASNPFSMPAAVASSSSSSLPQPLPFHQRPATLGLGAEPLKPTASSVENARLKGALVGKRKREEQAEQVHEVEDEEESKSHAVGKGKGKARAVVGETRGKTAGKDPFTSKKAKARAGASEQEQVAHTQLTGGEPSQQLTEGLSKNARKKLRKMAGASEHEKVAHSQLTGGESSQQLMEGLSKKAKKKLRKKMKLEEEARGASDSNPGLPEHAAPSSDAEGDGQGGESAEGRPMTTHQKSLLSHLSGARFSQINETLYTTSSASALSYIQGEPAKLQEYHEGFREQVKGWPKVPVRQIAEKLQKGQRQSLAAGSSKQQQQPRGAGRYAPGALVVDLGAGEAILAKLVAQDKTLCTRVLSYDLLDSSDGWVKGLDIARIGGLPLPGSLMAASRGKDDCRVVDVAVFCLSLMGTNWVEMIVEASRVTRTGGELLIAEVTSRFNTKAAFVKIVTSLGFRLAHEVRAAEGGDGAGELTIVPCPQTGRKQHALCSL